jgi:DNA-directed RNA polymerase specialized sigma24 family protein
VDEFEDLRQAMVLDYLRRLPKYDSTRGGLAGFIRGVMRNHATVLIKRRSRRVRHEVLADDLRQADPDNSADVLEIVHCADPTSTLLVSMDVQRVLGKLPRHLQKLAALLPHMPIAEICIRIRKSRSRTYQMIRDIRTAFVAEGLAPPRALPSPACGHP